MSALPSAGRADHAEAPAVALATASAAELYRRHHRRVFGYCLSRLGSREEAEDAAQSTFLDALRGLRRGIVPRYELAWLLKIAENVCRTRRRSAWRRRRVESPHDLHSMDDALPAPPRVDGQEIAGVAEALRRIPESQRRAILLREWRGLTYREIATELGLSHAAVETLIFRARRSLAQELAGTRTPRRVRGLEAGWLLGLFKPLLPGSALVKVAASVAVVASVTLAAGSEPVASQERRPTSLPTPTSQRLPVDASSPAATRHSLVAGKAAGTIAQRRNAARPKNPSAAADGSEPRSEAPGTVAEEGQPAVTNGGGEDTGSAPQSNANPASGQPAKPPPALKLPQPATPSGLPGPPTVAPPAAPSLPPPGPIGPVDPQNPTLPPGAPLPPAPALPPAPPLPQPPVDLPPPPLPPAPPVPPVAPPKLP